MSCYCNWILFPPPSLHITPKSRKTGLYSCWCSSKQMDETNVCDVQNREVAEMNPTTWNTGLKLKIKTRNVCSRKQNVHTDSEGESVKVWWKHEGPPPPKRPAAWSRCPLLLDVTLLFVERHWTENKTQAQMFEAENGNSPLKHFSRPLTGSWESSRETQKAFCRSIN